MNRTIQLSAQTAIGYPNRYYLFKGDVLRLPHECSRIRVDAGCIWLTLGGKDIVLQSGEEITLNSTKDFPIASVIQFPSALITTLLR